MARHLKDTGPTHSAPSRVTFPASVGPDSHAAQHPGSGARRLRRVDLQPGARQVTWRCTVDRSPRLNPATDLLLVPEIIIAEFALQVLLFAPDDSDVHYPDQDGSQCERPPCVQGERKADIEERI